MQFKIDENLPVELSELLSNFGHDAKTINDQGLQGAHDQTIIEKCRNEKRILVTLDIDFANIRTYPPQDHEGIIVLRTRNHSKKYVLAAVQKILPLLNQESVEGHLWIVEENIVRIRGEDK